MLHRIFIVAILMGLALPAAADFRPISRAYEISLDNFSAPVSLNAAAIFRECNDCTPRTVRVTANTDYRVNNQSVTLKEFRDSIFTVQNRSVETIVVLHHLESDTVEQILVTL